MIGSGPYERKTLLHAPSGLPPGTPGGSCSTDAFGNPTGQAVPAGGEILLTANPLFERGVVAKQSSEYQKFSWTDKFDQGVVTIADISDLALHYKHYDPYWANQEYSDTFTCFGETVIYDSNGNNFYDAGEPLIFGTQPGTGPVTAGVINDLVHFKFVGPAGLGHWVPGDSVIYDANNDNKWDPGAGNPTDQVIAGPTPIFNAFLSSDSNIKFVDYNLDGVFNVNLPCVDAGVLSTAALLKGIGVTDLSLGVSVTGLDPHFDRFDSSVAPIIGGYFLTAKQTSQTTTQVSVLGDSSIGNPITAVSAEAEGSGGAVVAGSCSATFNPVAPDGPGRTTYKCSFNSAVVEVEYTLTFANGATTEVHG